MGVYLGDQAVVAASSITTGDLVPLSIDSIDGVRNVEWSDFLTLFTSLPVADTTAIVKGSADATKLLRFEVDGFTAGATRVLTPPNSNGTIACINVEQTWSESQTFGTATATNLITTSNLRILTGNIVIGGGILADGEKVFFFGNATSEPTFGVADGSFVYSLDYAAGDARIKVVSESGRPIWIGNNKIEASTPVSGTGTTLTLQGSDGVGGNSNSGGVTLRSGVPVGAGTIGSHRHTFIDGSTLTFQFTASTEVYRVITTSSNTVGTIEFAPANGVVVVSSRLVLGTASFSPDSTGTNTISIVNGTAPATAPADSVQLFSQDYAAGDARLRVLSETGGGLWIGNNTLEAVAPTSGAGNSVSILASAAVTSGQNGGNILLLPGLKSGAGSDGKVIIRQPGGVADTDQVEIYDDGTNSIITSRNAQLRLGGGGATDRLRVTSSGVVVTDVEPDANGTRSLGTTALRFLAVHSATFSFGPNTAVSEVSAGLVRLRGSGTTVPAGLCSPVNAPAQITGDQNNYSPGVGLTQEWNSDASRNVTGMLAGQDGEIRWIYNSGAQDIVLQNENASSTAANRWLTNTGADITLAAAGLAMAIYRAGSVNRWRVRLFS